GADAGRGAGVVLEPVALAGVGPAAPLGGRAPGPLDARRLARPAGGLAGGRALAGGPGRGGPDAAAAQPGMVEPPPLADLGPGAGRRGLFHQRAGVSVSLRNSTEPWSPCTRTGPGAASSLSSAPPVMPGMAWRSMTRSPLSNTVTTRPTSVTSSVCHSPAFLAA